MKQGIFIYRNNFFNGAAIELVREYTIDEKYDEYYNYLIVKIRLAGIFF